MSSVFFFFLSLLFSFRTPISFDETLNSRLPHCELRELQISSIRLPGLNCFTSCFRHLDRLDLSECRISGKYISVQSLSV
jgi:hypothetical protein